MTEQSKRPSVDSFFAQQQKGSKTSSTDKNQKMGSGAMGKTPKESKKPKKPKERWLLTRKTWRYMTDAGRRLIPEGALNRVEDVPKIEAYFQEVCQKEPRFLLWRKGSYPGALGFHRSRRRRKDRRVGGSCRTKSSSADEADDIKKSPPGELATIHHSGSKFDIHKLKYDFLNRSDPTPSTSRFHFKTPLSTTKEEDVEDNQLVNMLEKYLNINAETGSSKLQPSTSSPVDYQELIEKLQQHLNATCDSEYKSQSSNISRRLELDLAKLEAHKTTNTASHKALSETLSRYFSKSTNRDRVISNLLTDRKVLENLYFDLRKSRSFGTNRTSACISISKPQLRKSVFADDVYDSDDESEGITTTDPKKSPKGKGKTINNNSDKCVDASSLTLPLVSSLSKPQQPRFYNYGIQTDPVSDSTLQYCEEEYKKAIIAKEEEMKEAGIKSPNSRRRSSVDNDDVSQSVSDTIKRYLRMARKKPEGDKADRFKRINYDKNLRNIKAKNVVDSPSESDETNKGCQTDDPWVGAYRSHVSKYGVSEVVDVGSPGATSEYSSGCEASTAEEVLSPVTSPKSPHAPAGFLSSSQSFLSNLLHGGSGKHHSEKSDTTGPAAMQKSKSSSSVMHHGSRLVAKKIFRSRSKSQSRLQGQAAQSSWTPQGGCVWSHVTSKQVMLSDCSLLQLTEIERRLLQKVALAKLQALNLGCTVRPPTETVTISNKSKRRAYLLRRKAKTTGFFDTGRKEDKDKDGSSAGGLVFGIPLSQCIENDRISRLARSTSPFRAGGVGDSGDENSGNLRHHGSRSSFSSLVDSPGHRTGEESGSCESLMSGRDRMAGSVPGLLDTLAYEENSVTEPTEPGVPQMVTTCLRYLENHGLSTLGIFRVSSSKKRVRQLREDFDSGKEITLDPEEQCPHDVATLLKEYLRDLPDPLLCRELYQAFVLTQRIRNRRLQLEAIQYLVQLLPVSNRDTLGTLLAFLGNVANHSNDTKDVSGEWVTGNKMDSNNLATIFAPNILHCIKPGNQGKDFADRSEDRIDVINVVRIMIDHYKQIFTVSAELLDEVYVHMMDTNPEALDQLLSKRDFITISDELLDDPDLESSAITWTPIIASGDGEVQMGQEQKKTWSREEFLHEFAGMGGPNMAMRLRHRDRDKIRERSSKKRWRDESGSRRRVEDPNGTGNVASSGISSAMTILTTRIRGQKEDEISVNQQNLKLRSSSMDGTNSVLNDGEVRRQSSPLLLDNNAVITASLKIPVQAHSVPQTPINPHPPPPLNLDDPDIPYIEDGSCNYAAETLRKQQMTIGLIRTGPTVPPRRRQRSISGSDSSQASAGVYPVSGSLVQLVQQGYDSAMGSSTFSSPPHNTAPSSVSSSIAGDAPGVASWGSSPPTSPDGYHQPPSVNYIPDSSDLHANTPVTMQKLQIDLSSAAPVLQKVSITSTSELQQVRQTSKQETVRRPVVAAAEHRNPFSASISSIGGKVLRSKTEDFERLLNISRTSESKSKTTPTSNTPIATVSEKKKYTKRRYTDTRHETRHIPDSEALEKAPVPSVRTRGSVSGSSSTTGVVVRSSQSSTQTTATAGPVYKRRELIASVPKDRHSIL